MLEYFRNYYSYSFTIRDSLSFRSRSIKLYNIYEKSFAIDDSENKTIDDKKDAREEYKRKRSKLIKSYTLIIRRSIDIRLIFKIAIINIRLKYTIIE